MNILLLARHDYNIFLFNNNNYYIPADRSCFLSFERKELLECQEPEESRGLSRRDDKSKVR